MTEAQKHTPGPWVFEDGTVQHAESAFEICTLTSADDFPCITDDEERTEEEARAEVDAECAANGLVIAAAPDLLEALQELLAHASFIGIASHYENMARAAIAKAEGRS